MVENLSPREGEVALLVARGLSNKAVAHELGISDGTVKIHMHSILQKLGTKSRYLQPRRTSGFTGRGLVELYFYHVWPGTHAVNFAKLAGV